MTDAEDPELVFGAAAHCRQHEEVIALIHSRTCHADCRQRAAAYGMMLAAQDAGGGEYRSDALRVLDALGKAKADIDSAALHDPAVAAVTAAILQVVQGFAWEATIPCTEWPTPAELLTVVTDEAHRQALR